MANKDIEIEVKFPLNNPGEIKNFLNKNAKLISENISQKDSYYTPIHRDFLKVKYPFEWLRLRETSSGNFITYKHFYPENSRETDYCDEFETRVDDLSVMEKIFKKLDFKEAAVIDKVRTTWIFEKVEVVIDKIANLGTYMELELVEDFENPKEGKRYFYEVLKRLDADVEPEDLRGYPFRLLEKNGYVFED